MKRLQKTFAYSVLIGGLVSAIGCGLTPKTNSSTQPDSRAGTSEPVPLKKLSPELAAQACIATARQLEEKGRLQDAISQYQRARGHQPNRPGIAHPLAVLYDRLGDSQKAWKEYQTALAETPTNADLLNDIGYYHFGRQQLAEAEKAYRQAVELAPHNARAWTNLGLTLGGMQRYSEALAAFQKAGTDAQAEHNLGIVLAQNGEFEKARQAFQEARRLDPLLKQPEAVLNWLDAHPETTGEAHVSLDHGPANGN